SGKPIMPLAWPSMRSMARWVLPVLVGPKTAFRSALARARTFILTTMGRADGDFKPRRRKPCRQVITRPAGACLTRMEQERIDDESLLLIRSYGVHAQVLWLTLK